MAQGTETIFSNEELSAFAEQTIIRGPHYIFIGCGCTYKTVGDSICVLRINDNGAIRATCFCNQDCRKVFSCPAKFAKHALRGSKVTNWRTKVWAFSCIAEKIKLAETCLLKYYKGDEYVRPCNQVSHRDEFLSCTACNKVRRFKLQTSDGFRLYHFAAARENPTCSDMIPGRWSCEDREERSSRPRTGCRKNIKCEGCRHCVCFGCKMCRFRDCRCQACVDFYGNASSNLVLGSSF